MVKTYPNNIMKDLRENLGVEPADTSKDLVIMSRTPNENWKGLFEWNGLMGSWGERIKGWVLEIYNVDLNSVRPQYDIRLDLGKWEHIFGLLVVEYETHRDLLANAPENDVNLEDWRRNMLVARESMEAIQSRWEAAGTLVPDCKYEFDE